uniref:Trehalose 6-phosphate phosphatase n=1 Tax=Leersia perrieri TaxID=77586 RepID=A0A0D9VUP2_9ORYZ
MTKHGAVVVPEDAVAAAAGGGRHFSFPPPRTAAMGGGGGGESCKKLAAQQIDLGAAAVVTSWLDSMKASSPRHRLMAPAVAAAGAGADAEHDEWMEKHPSALGKFEAVAAAAKGKRIVVFLDYDGTLSPIVDDPDRAVMTDEMRDAVRGVAARFPTAIVSGRCRDKVFSFVKLEELYYAGSHGMDIQGPTSTKDDSSVLCQPAREFLPMIEEAHAALEARVEGVIPGAKVENNRFCLSVHFRRVDERRWGAVLEATKAVLRGFPRLRMTQGRKVLEIRPSIRWDKGEALRFLLSNLGFDSSAAAGDGEEEDDAFPIYIGDDRTDEDAFRVLRARGQGAGILVTRFPKEETCAGFSLRDPTEVKDFLRKLAATAA